MFKIEFVQNKKVVRREKCWDRVVAVKIARRCELVHYDCVNIYKQAGMVKKLVQVEKH
jgi:hypothetical protein